MTISDVSSCEFREYPPEVRDILIATGMTPKMLSTLPQFSFILSSLVQIISKELSTEIRSTHNITREWYYRGAALLRIVEGICYGGRTRKGRGDDHEQTRRLVGEWMARQIARERLLPELDIHVEKIENNGSDNVDELVLGENERKWFAGKVQETAEGILGAVEWMWTSSVPKEFLRDSDSSSLAESIRRGIAIVDSAKLSRRRRVDEVTDKMWTAFDMNSSALEKLADLALKSSRDVEEEPEIAQITEAIAKARAMRAKMKLLETQLGADTYTPEVVKGLDATQREIYEEMTQVRRRIRKVKGVLEQYNQDALGFAKVVEEYRIARRELAEKQWTIKTLGLN